MFNRQIRLAESKQVKDQITNLPSSLKFNETNESLI